MLERWVRFNWLRHNVIESSANGSVNGIILYNATQERGAPGIAGLPSGSLSASTMLDRYQGEVGVFSRSGFSPISLGEVGDLLRLVARIVDLVALVPAGPPA